MAGMLEELAPPYTALGEAQAGAVAPRPVPRAQLGWVFRKPR